MQPTAAQPLTETRTSEPSRWRGLLNRGKSRRSAIGQGASEDGSPAPNGNPNGEQTGAQSARATTSARDPLRHAILGADLSVVTPENIAFRYRVAGPFRRFLGFLFDSVIVFGGYAIVLGTVLLVGAMIAEVLATRFPFLDRVAETMQGLFLLLYFVGIFVGYFFYGALMETQFNGQTVGKMVFRMRVLATDGKPINAGQAMLRNLARFADCFPYLAPATIFALAVEEATPGIIPAGAAGFLAMACSQRFQRLGDLFAKTIVTVETKHFHEGLARVEDPRVAQLAEFIPANFVISKELAPALSAYVERRGNLSLDRIMEISQHLGEPLVKQFNFDPSVNHDLLLCALHYRTFHDQDETFVPPGMSPFTAPRSIATIPIHPETKAPRE